MDEKVDKLLSEIDGIYGASKSKIELQKYINYIQLRKEHKIDFGNFNIIINNKSIYSDETKKFVNIVKEILKINGLIDNEYYVQSMRDSKIKDIAKLQNYLIIFDTLTMKESIFHCREDIKKLIKNNSNNIFMLIENKISIDSFDNLEEFNVVLGELMTWNIKIEKLNENDKSNYIKKFIKENSLKLSEKSINSLKEIPYMNLKKTLFDLLIESKIKNIKTISDKKVKNEIINIKDGDDEIQDKRNTSSKKLQKGLEELNDLIGLDDVKRQVNQILNYVSINKQRGKMPMLHMCFNGNPGTGKTTVARIVGKIFAENKILSNKDNFVETSRDELVGKYVGWTATQTKKKIEEADGGVLFIDEAYSLFNVSNNDFGHECISTLIKEMENKKDSLCVILAGYTEDMNRLISSNPGFESRIQFNINFPNYSEYELYEIFKKMAKDEGYKLSNNIKESLIEYFSIEREKENFSNARCVRNIFEKVKFEQASRICNNKKENMNLIKSEDVENVIKRIKPVEKIKIGFEC